MTTHPESKVVGELEPMRHSRAPTEWHILSRGLEVTHEELRKRALGKTTISLAHHGVQYCPKFLKNRAAEAFRLLDDTLASGLEFTVRLAYDYKHVEEELSDTCTLLANRVARLEEKEATTKEELNILQTENLKLKEEIERLREELTKKSASSEEWKSKYETVQGQEAQLRELNAKLLERLRSRQTS